MYRYTLFTDEKWSKGKILAMDSWLSIVSMWTVEVYIAWLLYSNSVLEFWIRFHKFTFSKESYKKGIWQSRKRLHQKWEYRLYIEKYYLSLYSECMYLVYNTSFSVNPLFWYSSCIRAEISLKITKLGALFLGINSKSFFYISGYTL